MYYAEELCLRAPLQVRAMFSCSPSQRKYWGLKITLESSEVSSEMSCICLLKGTAAPRLQHFCSSSSEALGAEHHERLSPQPSCGLLHMCLPQIQNGKVRLFFFLEVYKMIIYLQKQMCKYSYLLWFSGFWALMTVKITSPTHKDTASWVCSKQPWEKQNHIV